jgi:hypothetical protein
MAQIPWNLAADGAPNKLSGNNGYKVRKRTVRIAKAFAQNFRAQGVALGLKF